ncbi:MAG: hypothetical protein ACREQK_06175 [Candidatus Binatia bacterium]
MVTPVRARNASAGARLSTHKARAAFAAAPAAALTAIIMRGE